VSVKQFDLVATGGTFDEIHDGHRALLSKAFEVGKCVLIGISSDKFAVRKKEKSRIRHPFEVRANKLTRFINDEFGHVNYLIKELNDDFGPTSTESNIQALIVSEETETKGHEINRIRSSNGLFPLKIITVPMLKAEDGQPLSSTRIRSGEIDMKGRMLKKKT
jgi:pantetheine-phosphate adenylyltransferase